MLQVQRGRLASSSISTPSCQSGARRLLPPPPTFLRMIEWSRRSPRSRDHLYVSDWGPTSDDELSLVLTSGQHTVTTFHYVHYVPLRSKVSNIRLLRPSLRFLLLRTQLSELHFEYLVDGGTGAKIEPDIFERMPYMTGWRGGNSAFPDLPWYRLPLSN
jgi:hypothetical protein